MIFLGLDDAAKDAEIARYCAEHGITKAFILSPERFRFACSFEAHEHIEWADIIRYKYYYRLLQEIGPSTLVVVNECLRTQNRNDLSYNCIRNYLNQTRHQLIFQYLPLIDTLDDFMTLFDFDTRSRWKRERFRPELLSECSIRVRSVPLALRLIHAPVDAKLAAAYAREKASLLAEVRSDPSKDPHIIPRNLLLMSGRAKLPHIDAGRRYVGRNNRFKLANLETYREANGPGERVVLELCHNFIEFTDFLAVSRQHMVDVLVADTKADAWYLHRYQDWIGRVRDAYAALHG